MLRFVVHRLAAIPPLLVLANFLGYAYAHLVHPAQAARNPLVLNLPAEAAPLLPAYADYFKRAMQLDFGLLPYAGTRDTIATATLHASIASLGLLGFALFLSVIAGLLLGLGAIRAEPPRIAIWLTAVSTIGLATPGFYLASLLISGTLLYIIYGPTTGALLPIHGFGWDAHLVLPALVLMLRPTAQIAQVTAATLIGELGKPYIQAARSRGYSWKVILRRHAFRNTLAAVITTIAGSLRFIVGELIIVERLFDWPGLGKMIAQILVPGDPGRVTQSQLFLDPPTMAALVTVFALLFVVADFIAALLAQIYDPRLRTS